jgi:hypothetical protein
VVNAFVIHRLENELRKPGLVSPFLAAVPGHDYLDFINRRIRRKNSPEKLGKAWLSVGNLFLKKAMAARSPDNLIVFPSHYFIPTHKKFERYNDDDPVYCEQHWGSTFGRYDEDPNIDVEAMRAAHMEQLERYLPPET